MDSSRSAVRRTAYFLLFMSGSWCGVLEVLVKALLAQLLLVIIASIPCGGYIRFTVPTSNMP